MSASIDLSLTILSVVVSALASGLLGVWIANYYQKSTELRKLKLSVLQQLMSNRSDVNSKEFIGAMNQVAITFCDSKDVLTALNAVDEEVRGTNRNPDIGRQRLLVLFKAMFKNLDIDTEPLTDDFFLRAFMPHQT